MQRLGGENIRAAVLQPEPHSRVRAAPLNSKLGLETQPGSIQRMKSLRCLVPLVRLTKQALNHVLRPGVQEMSKSLRDLEPMKLSIVGLGQ